MDENKTQAEIEAAARREELVFMGIVVTWFAAFLGGFGLICLGGLWQSETLLTVGMWIFIPTVLLAVIAVIGVACFVADSRL